MNLLHSIRSMDPQTGGPVEGILKISQALRQKGILSEVICLDSPNAPWLKKSLIPIHALGPGLFNYGFTPKLIPWLKKNFQKYDAIIIHGIWQYSCFGVWRTIRGSNVPFFVYPHGMLSSLFKKQYPLKHFKKSLYWLLGGYSVLRDAQGVFFTCEEEMLQAKKTFFPYKCNDLVIGFGTTIPQVEPDDQKTAFYNKFPFLENKRFILFLGRIHPVKGIDLLIKAFGNITKQNQSDFPPYLVIAGPEEKNYKKQMVKLSQRLGINDRIMWCGMLSGEVKWGAYRAAEVFILPSHHENFGVSVVEAMACGLPVLISNRVNIWKTIQQYHSGLIAEDNLGGVLALLNGWKDIPWDKKKEMRENSTNCFKENFDAEKWAQRLIDNLNLD